ncbi:MAG: hypothetical protein LQ340_007841 [Diploschistes diacapsis]|nr:MAG: hypothetical protein LQ340_007841 [Diploschistes diacapsis]
MRSSIIIASTLAALASAAPVPFPQFNPLSLLSLIPKYLPSPPPGSCPLTAATQPSSALPTPASGLTLALVAIGRGTQNYTCADSTATTIPVALGANATLFNASCIASKMSSVILQDITASFLNLSPSQIPLNAVGHHFFVDPTTPTFAIDGFGTTELKKSNSTSAPANAAGDVAWLKLDVPTTETSAVIKEVYRLGTQGGMQPSNCSGAPAAFQVQYAGEYWFYT